MEPAPVRSNTYANGPSSTSTPNTAQFFTSDDISSPSYIPRAARMVPTSSTVHTIQFKKICFPMSPRPDELWVIELTPEGVETWKQIETFLEAFDLTHDPSTILHAANGLRVQHQVPVRDASSSASLATDLILPHPEHPDVHFPGPLTAVPDQIHILQSCWGRSANYHSQGTTTSLYWPPWRNALNPQPTPSTMVPMLLSSQITTSSPPLDRNPDLRFQDGHLIPFGEMDISDSSV